MKLLLDPSRGALVLDGLLFNAQWGTEFDLNGGSLFLGNALTRIDRINAIPTGLADPQNLAQAYVHSDIQHGGGAIHGQDGPLIRIDGWVFRNAGIFATRNSTETVISTLLKNGPIVADVQCSQRVRGCELIDFDPSVVFGQEGFTSTAAIKVDRNSYSFQRVNVINNSLGDAAAFGEGAIADLIGNSGSGNAGFGLNVYGASASVWFKNGVSQYLGAGEVAIGIPPYQSITTYAYIATQKTGPWVGVIFPGDPVATPLPWVSLGFNPTYELPNAEVTFPATWGVTDNVEVNGIDPTTNAPYALPELFPAAPGTTVTGTRAYLNVTNASHTGPGAGTDPASINGSIRPPLVFKGPLNSQVWTSS